VTLTDAMRNPGGNPRGGIYIDLPDLERAEWDHVTIRARSENEVRSIGIGFNLREGSGTSTDWPYPYEDGENAPVIRDGTVQTYELRADLASGDWERPWRQVGLWFGSNEPGNIEILSVSLVSKATVYAKSPHDVVSVNRGGRLRHALYTHTPARVEYRLRVPQGGRLDMGLGVLRDDLPVTFRVEVQPPDGEPVALLEESYDDQESWGQRTVDLAEFAGQNVTLALESDAADAGMLAFWGAPTLSAPRTTEKPNVIFYVIDGGGAEYMSLYGYNRRTTPNLERLAAEGAVFERAYSNSSWTRPSTASFMTSLQHSVMGGLRRGFNVVPDDVPTMAQHLHRAGFQTSVFIANPNAGRMSGLERGVDSFREDWEEFSYGGPQSNHKQSSRYLHDAFWKWREAYPGEPYWVHFQTTDIHGDFPAVAPFAGLFVGPEQFNTWEEWGDRRREERGGLYSDFWENSGISRVAFFTVMQGLYDETMAHNDYQLGRLVERLKAEGEWENTLLIVGADHGIRAAMGDMAVWIQDSLPPRWSQPMFRPSISRIPLMFVWPGHIESGQRFQEPVVSMIDVLPTILDLLNLPEPEVMMGQSLAPVLLGTGGWEPRPVILDEFRLDQETDTLRGTLEVIDGRWGASLEINPEPPEEDEDEEDALWRRPVPLLLYDLWNDPYCLHSLHEERPDLVEKYTAFLEAQWEAHQALARRFTPGEQVELTPEQLETLRALGYIQ
jgi:arylsulfatase A-like enzyme